MTVWGLERILRPWRMQMLVRNLEGERAVDGLDEPFEELDEWKQGVDSDNRGCRGTGER